MDSLETYIQFDSFGCRLFKPVSFKDGLELLFIHKPEKQILYQVLDGKLRRIKRDYENRFVQAIANASENSIVFSGEKKFINWAPETFENGFYLEAEIVFEKPLTVGRAVDLMLSGKFVKLKNPKSESIRYLKLIKAQDKYFWRNTNGFDEPVCFGKLPLSELLTYEFFEIIKINAQEKEEI